jgi:hypothetical protein
MARTFADKFNDPRNSFATREEWQQEKERHFNTQAKKLKITGEELEKERQLFNQDADRLISERFGQQPVEDVSKKVEALTADVGGPIGGVISLVGKVSSSLLEQPTEQQVAKQIKLKQDEARKLAEEGGFLNSIQFGFAKSGIGGFLSSKLNVTNEGKIFRQTPFEAETIPEKAGEIIGQVIGESPAFFKGPTLGFVSNRVLREINKQEDDPEFRQIGLNFNNIAIEAGKGIAERIGFGVAGKITGKIGRFIPESTIIKTLGRGAVSVSGDVAAALGMGRILDGAEFSKETAISSAIMSSLFRIKGLASNKFIKESAARKLAKTENMPLKDARKMILTEQGFSELYRQKVKEKQLENERLKVNEQEAINLQKETLLKTQQDALLNKRAQILSDAEFQLQEFNRQQNKTINIDHFVNNSVNQNMKAFQKTNNKTFDAVQNYSNNERVLDGLVKNIKVQKGLGERLPSLSEPIRNIRDLNRFWGTSWMQAIAKDTVAGAIHAKRWFNYISSMEQNVGNVEVRTKNILSQFDKGLSRKDKIVKKIKQRDFEIDGLGGELMTKLLNNNPALHGEIVNTALKNKKLSPKVAENIQKAYPEMRVLYNELGLNFKNTGGKGINKNGELIDFNIVENNFVHRIPNRKKIMENPDGFMEAMHRLNQFDGQTIYNSEKWKSMPLNQKQKHALNFNDLLTEQMLTPKSGWQHKRRLENFPEEFMDLDFRKQLDYIKDITSRTEMNKHFGPKSEMLIKDFEAIQTEARAKGFTGKEYDTIVKRAEDGMKAMQGKMDKGNTVVNDALENLMNLNVFTMMTTSFVVQPTQSIQGLVATNSSSFLKALGILAFPKLKVRLGSGVERKRQQVFESREARQDYIKQAGINLDVTRKAMYDSYLGTNGILRRAAEGTLRYTGFERFDAGNRTIAGLSGMFYGDWLANRVSGKVTKFLKKNNLKSIDDAVKDPVLSKKLDKELMFETRKLAKLNIDPGDLLLQGIRKGDKFITELTEMQKKTAAREVEVDTNFRTRILDLPEFRKTAWGRAVGQFGSFDFQNTKHIRDNIWREAKQGNFQPLRYGLTAGVGVGAAALLVRQLITKSMVNIAIGENVEKGTIFEDLMEEDYSRALSDLLQVSLLMPMPVNRTLSFAKYGDVGLGPTANRALSVGSSVRDFTRTQDPTILADEMVKQLSPAGWASKRLFQPVFDDLFGGRSKNPPGRPKLTPQQRIEARIKRLTNQ